MFNMKEGIGAILLIVGIYACIRSFLGREFYLAGIGGSGPSKPRRTGSRGRLPFCSELAQ
jgi:hypothetical protein